MKRFYFPQNCGLVSDARAPKFNMVRRKLTPKVPCCFDISQLSRIMLEKSAKNPLLRVGLMPELSL